MLIPFLLQRIEPQMKNFFLVALLLFATTSFSQELREGYIVNLEGETIYGELGKPPRASKFRQCIFYEGDERTVYYPKDLQSYGFTNGDKFVSINIEYIQETENETLVRNNSFFGKVVVESKVSLYLNGDKPIVGKDGKFYDLLEDRKIVGISDDKLDDTRGNATIAKEVSTKWKGTLGRLMFDCEESLKTLERMDFSNPGIRNLVIGYNECISAESISLAEKKPAIGISLIPKYGVLSAKLKASSNEDGARFFNSSYSASQSLPIFEIGLHFPRISDRLSLNIVAFSPDFTFTGNREIERTREEDESYETEIVLDGFAYMIGLKSYSPIVTNKVSIRYGFGAASFSYSDPTLRVAESSSSDGVDLLDGRSEVVVPYEREESNPMLFVNLGASFDFNPTMSVGVDWDFFTNDKYASLGETSLRYSTWSFYFRKTFF